MTLTPPHGSPSGHADRKRRTAAALFAAARELFAERGLRTVTVEQIAARADVSVGSVYVHFGNKDALYARVVEEALSLSAAYLRERRWSSSPLQRIFNTGDAYVAFATEHPWAFQLLLAQPLERGDLSALDECQPQASHRSALIAQLSDDVQAAIVAGEIAELPVRHVLTYLWASWSGVIATSLRDDDLQVPPAEVRLILQAAGAALASGIAPSAPIAIRCPDPRPAAARAA